MSEDSIEAEKDVTLVKSDNSVFRKMFQLLRDKNGVPTDHSE